MKPAGRCRAIRGSRIKRLSPNGSAAGTSLGSTGSMTHRGNIIEPKAGTEAEPHPVAQQR